MIINETEQQYINAGLDDNTQDVYRANYGSIHSFDVCCALPKGRYSVVCKKTRDLKNVSSSLRLKGIDFARWDGWVSFWIDKPTRLEFEISAGGDSAHIVTHLRKQILLNNRNYANEEERLIAKDIKTRTNFGEEYNRTSFYDTIDECLMDEEDLVVDQNKSATDPDVRYLKMMRLEQLSVKLYERQQQLNKERRQLEIEANELLKK